MECLRDGALVTGPLPAPWPLQVLQGLRVALQAKGLERTALVGLDEWVAFHKWTQAAFQQVPALWNQLGRVSIHAYRVPTYIMPGDDPQIQDFSDFASVSAQEAGRSWDIVPRGPTA